MTSIALATVAEAGRTEPVCPETVRRELERVRGYQRAVGYASEGSRSLGLYTLLTDLFMAVNLPRLEALTVDCSRRCIRRRRGGARVVEQRSVWRARCMGWACYREPSRIDRIGTMRHMEPTLSG